MTRPESATREQEALFIAWSGSQDLAEVLEAEGYRLLRLTAEGKPATKPKTPPRLVILAAQSGDSGGLVDHVRAVRRRWPLVDSIVYAPKATPSLVRDLLQAGTRDVLLERGKSALLKCVAETLDSQRLLPMVDRLAERRVRSSRFESILSRSHAMWDVFETCARVAPTDANVLICGETGTGKELLARAVHRQSKRRGRFVAVNCSSLPGHLIESELFGHEKGAFTGAVRPRQGIFRHAEGGTVLLDEIGDMPQSAQQSLLRVLQERTIRPIGGTEEVPIDIRIVAATHVPLESAVAGGGFREDLYYRLDVIRLEIPPLRERPEDVVYLFGHFVKSLAKHYGVERPEVNDEFLARMTTYSWPGNVRELENFSERIVLRAGRKRKALTARDFSRLIRTADDSRTEERAGADAARPKRPTAATRSLEDTLAPVIERVERQYLEALLERTGGHMQESARRAGISRRTLQRKLRAHGIDKARFRGR